MERTGRWPVKTMKANTLPLRLRNGVIRASENSITIGSRFDLSGSRQFSRAIARLIQREPLRPIIDLSRTRSIDSSGFGALVSGLRRLGESGCQPVVVCANSSVRRLMDFAGVGRSFAVVDRLSDARKLLAPGASEDAPDTIAS
jgi:anti-anti-sigma factor